jgi:hypothetical protein
VGGKLADHAMVRLADGDEPKTRDQLGDEDQDRWEKDAAGVVKDPWQFTNYLPMLDDNGELYTFTTSSRGGIGAIAKIARVYAQHRKRHPDVFPLVKLGVDSYQHKDTRLGRIKFPVFEPAGYASKTDFLAALAAAGYAAATVEPVGEDDADEDKMSDEVPF